MYKAKGHTHPSRMTDLPKTKVEIASTAPWPRVWC